MRLSLRAQGGGFHPATMSPSRGYFHKKQKGNEIKRTPWLSSSPPTNCINWATWNLSDSPGLTQSTHVDAKDEYRTGFQVSVTVNNNPLQDYSHLDYYTPPTMCTYSIYCYCPWTFPFNDHMPTLLDYPGVSRIWHWSPALLHGSPNLPDKMDFWAFLCFSLKFSPFFFSKFELFYS